MVFVLLEVTMPQMVIRWSSANRVGPPSWAKSPRMEPMVGAPSRRTASRYWSMGWPER